MTRDFEFYQTPEPYTQWLITTMTELFPLTGTAFEPCVGHGAILEASESLVGRGLDWATNDLDPRWPADLHRDATDADVWEAVGPIDWTITNPPFTPAAEILCHALAHSRRGVAMHVRGSFNEPLKTGLRRSLLRDHPPTGTLWLPRFAYQRSKTTGKWTTDSVTSCWLIWIHPGATAMPFVRYAPEWLFHAIAAYEPIHRERMDELMASRAA